MFRLDGRAALVTGAARGIGGAIAVGLAEAGADVGCVDLREDDLASTLERIEALGRRAIALPADVSDPAAMDDAVARVEEGLGRLTLAVNSAGISSTAPAEDMEPEAWRRLLSVNLDGLFYCCQAEGRAMLRNGGGAIVNVASISATIANRGLRQAHYNAGKAGVVQLSRSLALEWADRAVRVNTISPGYVRTTISRGAKIERTLEQYLDDIPLKRMADTSEMIGPAVFLLSDASSYVTGSELIVDGGATSW